MQVIMCDKMVKKGAKKFFELEVVRFSELMYLL